MLRKSWTFILSKSNAAWRLRAKFSDKLRARTGFPRKARHIERQMPDPDSHVSGLGCGLGSAQHSIHFRSLSSKISVLISLIMSHSIASRSVAGNTKSIPFAVRMRGKRISIRPCFHRKHRQWHCVTQFSWHRISNSSSKHHHLCLCMSSIDSKTRLSSIASFSLCLTQSTSYPSKSKNATLFRPICYGLAVRTSSIRDSQNKVLSLSQHCTNL